MLVPLENSFIDFFFGFITENVAMEASYASDRNCNQLNYLP